MCYYASCGSGAHLAESTVAVMRENSRPGEAIPPGRHGVVVRRRDLLSVLDFALPGFGIPDPVDVTASRIHPFGSPLSLQSAI
jgi:hypothetical protein